MRLFAYLFLLLTALAGSACAGTGSIIRTVHGLRDALATKQIGVPFDVQATVTVNSRLAVSSVILQEGDEAVSTFNHSTVDPTSFSPGDVVRITGCVNLGKSGNPAIDFTNLVVVCHGRPPAPLPTMIDALRKCDFKLRLVQLEGILIDAFHDEIDADWLYFILQNGEDSVIMTSRTHNRRHDVRSLIGARVAAIGSYGPTGGARLYAGKSLHLDSVADIRVLSHRAAQLRSAEDIPNFNYSTQCAEATRALHCATGTVIAAWSGSKILIKTQKGRLIKGELVKRPSPRCGERISLTGYPETDIYNIILVRADWNALPGEHQIEPAQELRVSQIQTVVDDIPRYNFHRHGQAVRLAGTVRGQSPANGNGVLYVECDGQMVMVDVSATPEAMRDIGTDFKVSVSGTCVMETEKMGLNRVFPHVTGYRIVVRDPVDIQVLAHPAWWTPERLLTALGLLLVVVIAIVIWNTLLRRAVSRRSKELETEIVARIGADLKVYERTRLAVELHDTISQNLTGVAMRLRTAAIVADSDPTAVARHISLATKTLDACREDLRNCLWDLRNLTLDEDDVNEAIRKTLAPHLKDAKLTVRFRVPRDRMSDNTTHTILSIVRELTVNAVRHGKATSVRVAGSIEGDKLLCSVKDNGRGFVPDNAPGMSEGHFGLQGIRDRIKAFEGDFRIDSAPGGGTRVLIALNIPTGNGGSAT